MTSLFISGTDTDVGKTLFASALIQRLQQHGRRVMAFKPISCGAVIQNQLALHADTEMLRTSLNHPVSSKQITPWQLSRPVSPNIAASTPLTAAAIAAAITPPANTDVTIIEGAGGWYCPINQTETLADAVALTPAKVILVVGLRLGCLNHSILTARSIGQTNPLVGWVANHLDPAMQSVQENINTLRDFLDVPLLAEIPYLSAGSQAEKAQQMSGLIQLTDLDT